MAKLVKILYGFYPLIVAIIILWLSIKLNFTYDLKNFDKVLDGAITFSSIIVGFLGALLGILVSIKDSKIVQAIFETNERYTLKYFFNENFIIGLLVVIVSCIMQVLREYQTIWSSIFFYSWIVLFSWFLPSTYRIVNILMSVFFKTNSASVDSRPEGNRVDDQRREEIRQNLHR